MYQAFGKLLSAMNLAASALTLMVMIFIGLDVFGRVLFKTPLYGVPEFTKLSVVCLVWLQIAYTLHLRKHLRADTLLRVMPSGGRRAVMLANALCGAVIFAIIANAAFSELSRAWTAGIFEGEDPVRLPIWPVWLAVVAGAFLTAIEFIVQAAQALGFGDFQDEMEQTQE